jgi:hypothetical protein
VHNKEVLDNTEGAIKNGQSRETGNIGYTVHITHFSQVKQLFSAFIAEKYIKKKYCRNKKKKGNAMCPLSQTPV